MAGGQKEERGRGRGENREYPPKCISRIEKKEIRLVHIITIRREVKKAQERSSSLG